MFKRYRLIFPFILMAACGVTMSGCSSEKGSGSSTNTLLSDIHADYPDCLQSGCHSGFYAAGSVFNDFNGQSVRSGVQIQMVNVSTKKKVLLPKTDPLGNFYTLTSFPSGVYLMYAGKMENSRPSTTPHVFPEWKSCNRCHVPGGTSFGGYTAPTGTIKWRP